MNNPPNLQVGGTLDPDSAVYIERPEDTRLFNLLKQGIYVNLLTSRQMGKSSVMARTLRALEAKDIRTVFIDLAGTLGTPPTAIDYYLGLLNEIAYQLKLKIDVESWWAAQSAATSNQKLRRFFLDAVVRQIRQPIMIGFDEIDSTLKLSYTDDLFVAIRGIHNDRAMVPELRNITFCLIGVATPNELIKDRRTTPYNIGETLGLSDFTVARDDLAPLKSRLDINPVVGERLLNRVLWWTGGQPYLTMRFCSDLIDHHPQSVEDIDRYAKETFNDLNHLNEDPHIQAILSFVDQRLSNGAATLGLYHRILNGEQVADAQTIPHAELKLSGLVRRNQEGLLIIANRLYERLFNRAWIESLNAIQLISFMGDVTKLTSQFPEVIVGMSIEQYKAGLKRREQEVRAELSQSNASDREKMVLLKKQIDDIQSKLKNPEIALEDYKVKFTQAYKSFDILKREVLLPEQIKKAQETLAKGETSEAERLINQVLARSMENAAEASFQLGQLAYDRIDYETADRYYRQAVDLQPNNPIYINECGFIAYKMGHYPKAEPLYQKSLSTREEALGPDHPDVAISLNNLAELYKAQGLYGKAEPLLQRALTIQEEAFGPDHPDVATSLKNLAVLYNTQGAYAQAEPLYQRSLAIREKTLGPDHPDVAMILNNLALLYYTQGAYAQAEPLYERSLAIREKTLGPDHPNVATSLNNIAELYRAQGAYVQAEPLYQRSLEILEKTLGPEHPDVAVSLNNLAEVYRIQGAYAQAEPLYQRSLAIREKTLGPEHPDVATSLNNLAVLYDTQGAYVQAEPLYRRSLEIWEKTLGPSHIKVAVSLENYADLLRKLNRVSEAEAMEARAKDIRDKH